MSGVQDADFRRYWANTICPGQSGCTGRRYQIRKENGRKNENQDRHLLRQMFILLQMILLQTGAAAQVEKQRILTDSGRLEDMGSGRVGTGRPVGKAVQRQHQIFLCVIQTGR